MQDMNVSIPGGVEPGHDHILSREALQFVARLTRAFRARLDGLLADRAARRARWADGERLDFLPETAAVREGDWTVDPVPADLERRTVEITGPVDRKMIINALNSGADCFMADLEDATSPTWRNMVSGQVNLHDAVRREIDFTDEQRGKRYALADSIATLIVRPRGLHLLERGLEVDGAPVPGALFDFGLFFFHNARAQLDRGTGPYFYLPKLESHREAHWWNDVFVEAQEAIGLPRGTIKATVLIETLPAAFEMNEILYELREHSAGLNCGRWDYIFSFIKARRTESSALLPDRAHVTMEQPFMRAYTQLVVKTCHRRGAHAIGGMAAQIPIKGDDAANRVALERVRADKLREVQDGHDGTWVAHPALVPIAREVFEQHMDGPDQRDRQRDDVVADARALLDVPAGPRTEAGLRTNIRVGIRYVEAWLRGVGCVPLYHLMEDAATAEISRAQVWQFHRHAAALDNGDVVTGALIERIIDEELKTIAAEVGAERFASGRFDEARCLFAAWCTSDELEEFLTSACYDRLDN